MNLSLGTPSALPGARPSRRPPLLSLRRAAPHGLSLTAPTVITKLWRCHDGLLSSAMLCLLLNQGFKILHIKTDVRKSNLPTVLRKQNIGIHYAKRTESASRQEYSRIIPRLGELPIKRKSSNKRTRRGAPPSAEDITKEKSELLVPWWHP
ncbi:hypothetical protein E2C01_049894 [Portunus trituberculatus]|uniref:Uncharacterized protein n=1 Tax=Portunus trituberculatus TaxID=210409 RepID=A0A5B7GEB5_PORTR|nr:hypothetical protein [Portunus trituberculatus]